MRFQANIEPRLEIRGIATSASVEDSPVLVHDFVTMFLAIANCGIDLAGAQPEELGDFHGGPD